MVCVLFSNFISQIKATFTFADQNFFYFWIAPFEITNIFEWNIYKHFALLRWHLILEYFQAYISTRFEYIFDSFWMSIFSHMHKTELELNTISYEMWYPDIESPSFYRNIQSWIGWFIILSRLSRLCRNKNKGLFNYRNDWSAKNYQISWFLQWPRHKISSMSQNSTKSFCFSFIYLLNYVHFGWKPRKATLDGSTF